MRSAICLLFVALSTVMCAKLPLAPKPCVTPQVWESKLREYIPSRNLTVRAKVSVDGDGQRMRVAEMITSGGKRSFYDVILLYKEKAMYVVQIKVEGEKETRTCTKHSLTDPYPESLVPSDAKYVSEVIIGSAAVPGAGLLVDLYEGVSKKTGARYMIIVTNKKCIPVNTFGHAPNIGAFYASYYDTVLGIDDPERFVPPPECKISEMKPLDPKVAKQYPKGPLL